MQAVVAKVYGTVDAAHPGIVWMGPYEAGRTPQVYPNRFLFDGVAYDIDKNGHWDLGELTCWGDPFVERGVLKGFVIDSPEMRAQDQEMSDYMHAEFAEAMAHHEDSVQPWNYGSASVQQSRAAQPVQAVQAVQAVQPVQAPRAQQAVQEKPFDKRKRIPCMNFAKGVDQCKLGRECPYLHATKNVPCRHFVIGNCNKGNACHFRHSTQDIPCKHFVQGNCKNGDKCQYRHSTKDDVPCKFFVAGNCSHGNKCKYRHSTRDIACKHFVAGNCKKDMECEFRHSKKDVVCKFFAEGKCSKGDACEYAHK
jgi:hypothetical protein